MAGIETLVIPYIRNNALTEVEFLLGRKQRGLFQGCLVFPGGKPEDRAVDLPIEDRDRTAARELTEETGLVATELTFLGRLLIGTQGSGVAQQVDVVATQIDSGARDSVREAENSDLQELQWHTLGSLPIDELPADYVAWFMPAYAAIETAGTNATRRLKFQVYINKLPTAQCLVTLDWFIDGRTLPGIPQLLLEG